MHADARTGRVELDHGDMERFVAIADTFPAPQPWPAGRWLSEEPGRLWLELVAQLCVVGGRRPVERMWENGEMEHLALPAVRPLALDDPRRAEEYAHEILARNGVRYAAPRAAEPSSKARQIVSASLSPVLVSGGVFRLRALLRPVLGGPPEWGHGGCGREREARALLARHVAGFGMKSAGDYLNHVGAAVNLLAFDSRIQTVLRDCFGMDERTLGRSVSHPVRYEALERPFVEEVCPRLGMPPAVLDELLFANAETIRRSCAGRSVR